MLLTNEVLECNFTDPTIDQNLMRLLKASGGMTHARGITDSILTKWVHVMPRVIPNCNALDNFCGTHSRLSEQHVDLCTSTEDRDIKRYDLPSLAAYAFSILIWRIPPHFCPVRVRSSAFEKWAICRLMNRPLEKSAEDVTTIESFVVFPYSSTCPFRDVNQARQHIFARFSRSFEYIPPAKAALIEHVERVTYQAGYSHATKQKLPSSGSWEWIDTDSGWEPCWTPLPRAAKAIDELIHRECGISCT
ncbi:putative Nuclear pore membrane glycoprotein 210-like 3, partial [Homarus americanus]